MPDIILSHKPKLLRCVIFFITGLAIALASCTSPGTGSGDQLIAEVNGNKLTLNDIRQDVPVYIYEQDSIAAIREYRKNWVNRQVLLQEAQRLGLERNADVRKKLRRAEEEVLTTALIDLVQQEIRKEGVSRQEAQKFYENYRDQFILKERHVRYRHVITETMNSAQNARNALMRGVPWEEVARRYTVNAEEAIQNSTKFWPISSAAVDHGSMHQYLQVIGVTEISPVSVENGQFNFVQLRENRNEGEHPDLEWVLDQIEEWLLVEKQRRNAGAYERNLFLKAESNNEIKLYDVLNLEEVKEIQPNLEPDTITSN